MKRFVGKTILVTGATSGIGLAGAKHIVEEGGNVLATGMNPSHIEAAQKLLNGAKIIRNDAGDPEAVHALIEETQAMGGLDGLWLNAGYAGIGAIEETTADFFDRMMATNVRGPLLQLAGLSPLLKKGASVVLTASTSAYEHAPMASVYAATKGAMISMVRCIAAGLAPRGIRVNVLVPGPIDTNFRTFMSDDLRHEFESEVISRVPLSRSGTTEEAAAVALFLLSDAASYVTGSQYAVDGGLTMR